MSYEVYGYVSQEDFDNVKFIPHDEGLVNKKDALEVGKEALETYPIVKVQSYDREFIEILNRS